MNVPGEVIGRNALLLTSALAAKPKAAMIGIGIHAGTAYSDCSPAFVSAVQAVFDLSTGGRCRVDAPFLAFTKADVFRLARELDAPLDQTYSCELGLAQPCGRCSSCSDLVSLWSSQDVDA
jgi:7-cyano-7-deazaguanine synthase